MNTRCTTLGKTASAPLTALLLVLSMLSGEALAKKPFKRIVVFGTSISDSGNFYALETNPDHFCARIRPRNGVPPYGNLDALRIPDRPYAKGGHHFTNGRTWIEQYGIGLGLSGGVAPAFRSNSRRAANYAVGGARATNVACRIDLPEQLAAFESRVSGRAPGDALYVLEFGSNDVRDALEAYVSPGGGPQAAVKVLSDALEGIALAARKLYGMGARKFLFATTPNIGRTWALQAADKQQPGAALLAEALAQNFNAVLTRQLVPQLVALPGVEFARILDVYGILEGILADPGKFGLRNTSETCVTPNVRPYQCKAPDRYLFWDGIHPTRAAYRIFAVATDAILGGNKNRL